MFSYFSVCVTIKFLLFWLYIRYIQYSQYPISSVHPNQEKKCHSFSIPVNKWKTHRKFGYPFSWDGKQKRNNNKKSANILFRFNAFFLFCFYYQNKRKIKIKLDSVITLTKKQSYDDPNFIYQIISLGNNFQKFSTSSTSD